MVVCMMIVWPTDVQKKAKNKQMNSLNFGSIYKLPKNINKYNQHQKQQFKMQKKNLKPHEVVAVIDFKENLHLNMATEESSYNYYDKP